MRFQRLFILAVALLLGACAGKETRPELEDEGWGAGKAPAVVGAAPSVAALTDKGIQDAIQAKLFSDPYVSSRNVRIDIADGVVTLKGTVANLRAGKRVLEIASEMQGVVSVVNLLVVRPTDLADPEIQTAVATALALNPTTELGELDIRVEEGKVRLGGTTETWAEKSLAEWVAAGVRGVVAVENEIEVEYPFVRPSEEIQTDIQGLFRMDPWINERLIDVSVAGNNVILSGVAGSLAEKLHAYHAAWVHGVESVNAQALVVRPTAGAAVREEFGAVELSDARIEGAVEQALARDPRVTSGKVRVNVKDGVVRLSGTVPSLAARYAAAADASNTAGVWRVRNQLQVVPVAKREDRKIANDVRGALTRQTEISPDSVDGIIVGVSSGVVTLGGEVDKAFEKWLAEQAAAEVPGVRGVINRIDAVSPLAAKSDSLIQSRLRAGLEATPMFDEDDQVLLDVEDGFARLEGVVDTRAEHMTATTLAFEAGAQVVSNGLRVRSQPELPPDDAPPEELQLYRDDYQSFFFYPLDLPAEKGAKER